MLPGSRLQEAARPSTFTSSPPSIHALPQIYPSQFPDQPEVSLLLLLRGELPAADWPPLANQTTEPPTGKGPEVSRAGGAAHALGP